MKFLDTSAINFILKNNSVLEGSYFVTPDIEQEMSVAEISLKTKAPGNIKNIVGHGGFNEVLYVKNYFEMLNKHGGRSFFNMGGFGDISLLAAVKTVLATKQRSLPLPSFNEDNIEVYSNDLGLIKRIKSEGAGRVKIYPAEDLG